MDFKGGLVISNSKARDGLRIARVLYDNGKFIVILSNGDELDIDNLDIKNNKIYKYLYSRPENNKHTYWTKKKNTGNCKKCDIILQFWSVVKPGQKVKGIIENNKFVIKKVMQEAQSK